MSVVRPWTEPFELRERTLHEDSRGLLFEILRFADEGLEGQGQVYTFSIEPGQRRGDHFHTRKREWFTCVHGEATVLLEGSDGTCEAFVLTPRRPSVIYAGPHTAHALLNQGEQPAVIVSYGSAQHHPEDPDTYPKHTYADWRP